MLESSLRGIGQGATGGFSDEAMGFIGSLVAKALRPDLFEGRDIGDMYKEGRDIARGQEQAAREANPITYNASDIVGGVAMPAGALGKGATVADMARVGLGAGILQGAGRSEGENLQQVGNDALISGAVGTVAAPAIGKAIEIASGPVSRAASATGKKVKDFFTPKTQLDINISVPKSTPREIQEALINSGDDVKALFKQNVQKGLSPEDAYVQALAQKENVRLSAGDATQDLFLQSREEDALKGLTGPGAQATAKQFRGEQANDIRKLITRKGSQLAGRNAEAIPESDIAERITTTVRRLAQEAKDAAQSQYPKNGRAFVPVNNVRQFVRATRNELLSDGADFQNMPILNSRMRELEKFVKPKGMKGVNFPAIEVFRKRLNGSRSANPSENRYLDAMKRSIDDMVDDAVETGVIWGNTSDITATQAGRKAWAEYRQKFFGKDGKAALGKIVEKDMTPEETMRLIIGSGNLAAKKDSSKVVAQLKNVLGETSPEFKELKQAGFYRIIGDDLQGILKGSLEKVPQGQGMAGRLNKFVKENRSLWNELYTPGEQKLISDTVRLISQATMKQEGVVNRSNSANVAVRLLSKLPFVRDVSEGVAQVRAEREVGSLLSGNVPVTTPESATNFARVLGSKIGATAGAKAYEAVAPDRGPISRPQQQFSPIPGSKLPEEKQKQIFDLLQQ